MTNDTISTSTLVNVLSAIVGGIVLRTLGSVYKSITSLFERVEALEEIANSHTDHLSERDGYKLPAHLRRKQTGLDLGD